MFGSFFSKYVSQDKDESANHSSRRKHPRRKGDDCAGQIGNKLYPVVDWSMGGFLISADDRLFGTDQDMDVVMKFRTKNDAVVDIPHKARVIRKSKNRIAFEFFPLSKTIKNHLQSIVDDYNARMLMDSQTI